MISHFNLDPEGDAEDKFLAKAFDHVDSNDDNQVDRKEFMTAIRELAKASKHVVTTKDQRNANKLWRRAALGNAIRNADIDERQFAHLARAFFRKFGINW